MRRRSPRRERRASSPRLRGAGRAARAGGTPARRRPSGWSPAAARRSGRRRGRGPALDPARHAPAGAARGLGARPGGRRGAAGLRDRRGHRADAQPARQARPARRGSRAAWRSPSCTSDSSWCWPAASRCSPTRSPTRSSASSTTCRAWSRSANQLARRPAGTLDQQGIQVQIQEQGQTALQTLQKQVLKRSRRSCRSARTCSSASSRPRFALILVLVISIYMLLYGERIGALVRSVMPPGDGTAEDDFPIGIQRAVFGYVRGQLLFSLIMGTSAGVVPVDPRRRGHLPRRPALRGLLRRLLRVHGADPLRRPDPRRASRRSSSRCSATR